MMNRLVLSLIVLILALELVRSQPPSNYNEEGWTKASGYLSQYMDKSADPCDNFFQFMCGNFGNASDNETYYTWENERRKVLFASMSKAIKGINPTDPKTPEYAQVVRNFYDKCIAAKIDANTLLSIYETLREDIGPFPVFDSSSNRSEPSPTNASYDIWHLIGKLQRDYGRVTTFKTSFTQRVGADGSRIAMATIEPVYPRSLAMGELRNLTLRAADILKIKMNKTDFEDLLNETQSFLSNWTWAWLEGSRGASDDASDDGPSKAIVSITTNLSNAFPNSMIDWDAYFRGLLNDEAYEKWYSNPNGIVLVQNAGVARAIATAISEYSPRAVKTALYTILMRTFLVAYTGRDMETAYWIEEIDVRSREPLCIEYVIQQVAPAAVRVYFDHIGEDVMEWRHQFLIIQTNIFSAMRLLLNSVDYLGAQSKERINRKIDAIQFNCGIPSWMADNARVLAASGYYNESLSLAANAIRRNRELFREELQKLIEPGVEVEEPPSFELNDFYDPQSNDIHLFVKLGDNLPPQFSLRQPLALKYGGLGFTIGHELMHAFDVENIKTGLNDDDTILEAEELEVYEQHAQCLAQQYSSSCYKRLGACQRSKAAMQDNIADTGGLKAAYAAYQFVKSVVLGDDDDADEPPVPGFEAYTGEQLFYMTFQRYFCTRNDPVGWLESDHTPDTVRATVPLRNNPHFAKAFGCAVGSRSSPVKQCKMWGDIFQ